MNIEIVKIPNGHALSFKRGCSDGLLNKEEFINKIPHGHSLSYRKGVSLGKELQKNISLKIKEIV